MVSLLINQVVEHWGRVDGRLLSHHLAGYLHNRSLNLHLLLTASTVHSKLKVLRTKANIKLNFIIIV